MAIAEFDQKKFLEFLKTPHEKRDHHWEELFLRDFPKCSLTLVSEIPQVGPDQFPYMIVETKEDSSEPALNLLHWIAENGVGLAVNTAKKPFPDFVFTYGMIWNYVRTGNFLDNPLQRHDHECTCGNHNHQKKEEVHSESLKEGTTLYTGSPSAGYLPDAIRVVLREFLKQQGIMAPKITMLSADKINFDLCFSVESLGSPQEKEHEGVLQAISWFLPAHYSLALVSEKNLPSFEEL